LLSLETARSWYPAQDPVHGFDHVERVYRMAEHLALAEGANLEIVRAAALLHDASGSHPATETNRESHQHASADFARQVLQAEGWSEERIQAVLHCIRAHRFRDESEQPQTLEAMVLFDADKLDAIGATGVARAIGYSVQAGQAAYSPPSPRFLQTGEKETGEAHSAYHEYLYKLVRLKDLLHTPTARHIAERRHHTLVEYFEALRAEAIGDA
jgi:uncharacterized protein